MTPPCAWCPRPIPANARADSIYCSKSCRQAAHRFRRGYTPRPVVDGRRLRMAYADPPYPGLAKRYYEEHADYAGEVDHRRLVEQLVDEYTDGWALSTNARSLQTVLALCPTDVRVACWVRGPRPGRSSWPLGCWEPVIFRGGRQEPPALGEGPTTREDTLIYHARARLTEGERRVTGAKPAEFLWWLFDLLGAQPGDELVDVFPGSGGVARAWEILGAGPPAAAGKRRLFDPAALEA